MKISLVKLLYILLGTLSLVLGLIGIVVPGLPTTPFLLLTALLYMRGSARMYQWLLGNKWLGPYIIEYRKNGGLSRQHKAFAILLMWTMVTLSVLFFIPLNIVKIIIILAGITGTWVVSKVVPTATLQEDKANIKPGHSQNG